MHAIMAINMWLNSTHQASKRLSIMHQYDSMLCIHCSMMCIRHQYGLMFISMAQCCVSGFIMAKCCAGINSWPNAVHRASLYAQTCASCVNIARCGLHSCLKLCIMHWNTIWLDQYYLVLAGGQCWPFHWLGQRSKRTEKCFKVRNTNC